MKSAVLEEGNRELCEAEAIRSAQDGNAGAFEQLYNLHSQRVYSLCLRMLKDRSDAEDLTQQVFLVVFRKIATFRGDSCFSTWLHRVTVNAVLMHMRRRGPKEIHPDSSIPASGDSEGAHEFDAPDTSNSDTVERLNLKHAISRLPAGCRRLFVLHEVMGYRHDEIAELVGCSVSGSKSQVHRARKRLRTLLQARSWQADPGTASA
jgi:RNA polymerase sigma-70 factor, ECF subfamily